MHVLSSISHPAYDITLHLPEVPANTNPFLDATYGATGAPTSGEVGNCSKYFWMTCIVHQDDCKFVSPSSLSSTLRMANTMEEDTLKLRVDTQAQALGSRYLLKLLCLL